MSRGSLDVAPRVQTVLLSTCYKIPDFEEVMYNHSIDKRDGEATPLGKFVFRSPNVGAP